MSKLKPELVSAIQEFLRTLVLGMMTPIAASLLVLKSGINVEVGGFEINWLLAASVLVSGLISAFQTSLLSAVDKYIHKIGVTSIFDFKSLDTLK